MSQITREVENGRIILHISGRIDSSNAQEIQNELEAAFEGAPTAPVEIDARDLEYISSAGLRLILRMRKQIQNLTITNVHPDVYEIFETTGFTQMMTVEKAYKTVSVEGCEMIGHGANGNIYRIDADNVVKVYNDKNALEEIRNERELARKALVLGIPTAISYDIVRVGESYGSVFELLDAHSLTQILISDPGKMDWCVREFVELLKKIHETLVPPGELPDIRKTVREWAKFVRQYLPDEEGIKLVYLVEAMPRDDHMIHGDYHTKNVVVSEGETLLIDMDTLAVGHPVFELASMYNAFVGFSEYDHSVIMKYQGFDRETAKVFWEKTLTAYLGTANPEKIREVEDKARIIGYTRMIRRSIRRGGLDDAKTKEEIDLWKSELIELLHKTETLMFVRNEISVMADKERLNEVLGFLKSYCKEAGCTIKDEMQLCIAAEEIFVNISNYAYGAGRGIAYISVDINDIPESDDREESGEDSGEERGEDSGKESGSIGERIRSSLKKEGRMITVTFRDQGVPYDPLQKEDPDVSLPAEKRAIGGLGIFMVKKIMDDISYERKDGQNILKISKKIR